MPHTNRQQFLGLIAWIAICFAAAAIGMLATISAPEFYNGLARPSWAPASSVFGPVWTLLYILIAISAWLVWRKLTYAPDQRPLVFFIIQLILNAAWSWLFFYFHSGLGSFINIVLLWIFAAITLHLFFKQSTTAGLLFIPYMLWITFAAALNFTVWQLNPTVLG